MDHSEGLSQRGNVTISVAVINWGGHASEGYISVYLPGKERIERIDGTGSSMIVHLKESCLEGKEGEIISHYPPVELVEYEWGAGKEEILNVNVMPDNVPNNLTER